MFPVAQEVLSEDGECVFLGMTYMCSDKVRERITNIGKKWGMKLTEGFDKNVVMQFIGHDKKSDKNGITVVWVNKPGEFEFKRLSKEEIEEILEKRI